MRLTGELLHWSPALFNSSPGGGGALVGITWLVPIFGVYFAFRLASLGEGPAGTGRSIGMAVLGFVLMASGAFVVGAPQIDLPGKQLLGSLFIVAGVSLQFRVWPALAKVLLAYGYAARVPVVVLTLFAIRGNWGTHYDALPPGFIETSFWQRLLQTGLIPQLVFWVAFTVLVGMLFGSIAVAISRRRSMGTPIQGRT